MILVSLTTTSQRLHLCRMTLASLLLQSRKPDRILVWISERPYLRDQGITDAARLDAIRRDLAPLGNIIEFRWTHNIGPYRKLMPTLQTCQRDDLIVTADDDIFYGEHWLERLLGAFGQANQDGDNYMVAARVRAVLANPLGRNRSYLSWPVINTAEDLTDQFVVTFGGGAVLRKSFFMSGDIRNVDYLRLAPTADDLWCSKLLIRNEITVRTVPEALAELNFVEHDDGLLNYNVPTLARFYHKLRLWFWDNPRGYLGFAVCGNDIAYRKIERYFGDVTHHKHARKAS